MEKKAPEWVEPTIVNCAKIFKKEQNLCIESLEKLNDYYKVAKEEADKRRAEIRELPELWVAIRKEYFPERKDVKEFLKSVKKFF